MAGRGVLVLCYAATGRVYSLARSTFQKGELGCGSEKFAGWGRVRPAGLQGFDGWRWTRVRAIPEKRRRRAGITRALCGPIRDARCVSLSAARMPHARHALARARSARATWLRWDAHPVYFVRISGRIAGDFVFGQD